ARLPRQQRRILLDALAVRDQRLSGDALAEAVAALRARIDALCARRPTHDPNRRLVKHVNNERKTPADLLTHPGVEATNWEAEQALRGMIVNRKCWGGNKTRKGADTAAVLASVLRTAAQQGADPVAVLAEIQRTGTVPAGLTPAGAGHWP
ncbi:MAG: IS66 family transposase, partial [Pseudonocardiaceae bacterium]